MKILYVLLLLPFNVMATLDNFTIYDTYYGGTPSDPKNIHNDVIGPDDKFNVQKIVVNRSGQRLIVDVYTGFITNKGLGFGHQPNGKGRGLGDLFISIKGWNPAGSRSNNYIDDDLSTTGTVWNYVVPMGNKRWSALGNTTLYKIDSPESYLTSNDFQTGKGFRDNQLVAVDLNKPGLTNTGEFAYWDGASDPEFIRFIIDIEDTILSKLKTTITLHWTMTCGNDVIEGGTPNLRISPRTYVIPGDVNSNTIPEPSTILLLFLGLGIVLFFNHKRK